MKKGEKMEKQKRKAYIGHGEATFFEIDNIPADAKPLNITDSMLAGKGLIVANSETSGNHHCVELEREGKKLDLQFFEKDGTLYLKNNEPTKVFCSLDRKRHPEDTIRPSAWKINITKEFDLLERARRNVRD